MKPPTSAPTSPSAMLMKQPCPRLLTTRLAKKPVISPKNIQPRIDMRESPMRIVERYFYKSIQKKLSWPGEATAETGPPSLHFQLHIAFNWVARPPVRAK